MSPSRPVDLALATLRQRWGTAAPRTGREAFGEVVGSLATVPLRDEPLDEPFLPAAPSWPGRPPSPVPALEPVPAPDPSAFPPLRPARPDVGLATVIPTGFAELDAILGPGGVPRAAGLALSGDLSSGRTTLALRLVSEAQAAGSIVAWLDVDRAFDPVEAVARGVRLEWLVVAAPATLEEGLSMAGALLQGRAVDLLLVDLPPRPGQPGRLADALARLAALARRAGALLVVLEPPGRSSADLLGSTVGLRLELRRRSWIRLGQDVVGQRTEVEVARSRFGPPGRRAELRILYAEGGPRDACLRRAPLLGEVPLLGEGPPATPDRFSPATPDRCHVFHPPQELDIDRSHATAPSLLAAPPSLAGPGALDRGDPPGARRLTLVPRRPARPRRPALDRRDGARRGRERPRPGDPACHAARHGAPAGT
jgi:hypothetical protein